MIVTCSFVTKNHINFSCQRFFYCTLLIAIDLRLIQKEKMQTFADHLRTQTRLESPVSDRRAPYSTREEESQRTVSPTTVWPAFEHENPRTGSPDMDQLYLISVGEACSVPASLIIDTYRLIHASNLCTHLLITRPPPPLSPCFALNSRYYTH